MSNQMYRKIIVFVFCCLFFACLPAGRFSAAFAMGEKVSQSKHRDFTLKDIHGHKHTLSDYRGKYVFLNFWATWCPPCRDEMPSMQKVYDTWNKKDYVMLAVNINENRAKVKRFAQENGYTFPILIDNDGKIASRYGIRGIPATFFIDKQGNVVKKIVGSRHWDMKTIKRAFKK